MSRDHALYTISFLPVSDTVLKLTENAGIATLGDERYVRVLESVDGEEYSAALYDALSGAKLASTGFFTEKSKTRRLALHGPDETIPWENTGRLFEWTFTFEGNQYRWKKASPGSKELACLMKRGGDPDVEICLYRPGNSDRRSQYQILHYNLERFLRTEIKDIRGLETLLAITCVSLEDAVNNRRAGNGGRTGAPAPKPAVSPAAAPKRGSGSGPATNGAPPPVPPKVPPKSATPVVPPPPPQLVEMLMEEEEGEVLVGVNTDLETHIARANRLLADENVLFIIIRSRHPDASARATEVSLGVQRYRHRNMLPELHRYIQEEEEAPKGPRVINLDDPPAKPAWKPPPRLAIYLSRIELPDLAPKNKGKSSSASSIKSPVSPTPQAQPHKTPSPVQQTRPPNVMQTSLPPPNLPGRPHSPGGPSNGRLSPQPGYQPPYQPRPQSYPQAPLLQPQGQYPPGLPPRVPSPSTRPPVAQAQSQQHEHLFSKLLKPSWK